MKEIEVYAAHQTAPIWYQNPPNDISYYVKVIKKSELTNGIYLT